MMFKRYRRVLTLTALTSIALVAAGCADGGGGALSQSDVVGQTVEIGEGGQSVVIGLTYVPNVQFAPVYVAAADEVFRAAGVGAGIRHHGTDEGLFTALATGDEDVTVASGDEVLQARASGLDLVAIGSFYNKYPVSIISRAEDGYESISDLAGKRIGLPGEYGSNWFGLLAALDEAGMTIDDVTVVSVGYTQASSLATKEVDAVVGFVNSETVQLQKMGVDVSTINLADSEVPLVGATIVSTREWVENNPALAKATIQAITNGMDRVIQNPQHAVEVTSSWDPSLADPTTRETATALLEATLPLWEGPDGTASTVQDLEVWQRMAPFLARVLDADLDAMGAEQAVTNEYAYPAQ